jgi:uncharacterized protein (DUF305 family)
MRGTSHSARPRAMCRVRIAVVGLFAVTWACAADQAEVPFGREIAAAMSRMMAAMTARPTGDVDADFVATMVPHHQGAIEMAQAELRYGHNEQLRRIAQEIIVDQTQEMVVMRLAIEDLHQ